MSRYTLIGALIGLVVVIMLGLSGRHHEPPTLTPHGGCPWPYCPDGGCRELC